MTLNGEDFLWPYPFKLGVIRIGERLETNGFFYLASLLPFWLSCDLRAQSAMIYKNDVSTTWALSNISILLTAICIAAVVFLETFLSAALIYDLDGDLLISVKKIRFFKCAPTRTWATSLFFSPVLCRRLLLNASVDVWCVIVLWRGAIFIKTSLPRWRQIWLIAVAILISLGRPEWKSCRDFSLELGLLRLGIAKRQRNWTGTQYNKSRECVGKKRSQQSNKNVNHSTRIVRLKIGRREGG